MTSINQVADEFLAGHAIAVTGVSRNPQGHGSNAVYTRLKERGYDVYAVNPNAEAIDEAPAYPNLAAIPVPIDGVVIGTRPEHALATMKEAAELGITRVWMHRGPGRGSFSPEAAKWGRDNGITVIPGGCPLMFGPTSDGGHRFMCTLFKLVGKVPRSV